MTLGNGPTPPAERFVSVKKPFGNGWRNCAIVPSKRPLGTPYRRGHSMARHEAADVRASERAGARALLGGLELLACDLGLLLPLLR